MSSMTKQELTDLLADLRVAEDRLDKAAVKMARAQAKITGSKARDSRIWSTTTDAQTQMHSAIKQIEAKLETL
ncbi:hypothetical protein VPHK120G1_0011 [Vibrio phage K120 g1]